MSSATVDLENNSIYIFLNLRGAEPGFHWGLFVPTNKPYGEVYHAVNRTGSWSLEILTANRIPNDMSLCLCYKVGMVIGQNWQRFGDTLKEVAASGHPSPNTGEAFSCRVWLKDALTALNNVDIIHLTKDVREIEQVVVEMAEANRSAVERGSGGAVIWNATNFPDT